MPLLDHEVPRPTAVLLREAVRRHAAAEHRRRFAPLLHLGRPGVRERTVPATLLTTDHALRCDLVAGLLATAGEVSPLVWLTRPGSLEPEDLELAWCSAAWTAASEAGRDLTCVVVTRHGWRDPRSGVRREWQRIRG